MAQIETKNCSKTAIWSKKLFKNSKNRKRDSVTFLKRSTFWPRIYVENTRDSVFFGLFSVSVTWQGQRSDLLRYFVKEQRKRHLKKKNPGFISDTVANLAIQCNILGILDNEHFHALFDWKKRSEVLSAATAFVPCMSIQGCCACWHYDPISMSLIVATRERQLTWDHLSSRSYM